MKTATIPAKRAAEDVGQPITSEFANYLTAGFKEKFPGETPAVFIARDTIMRAIENLDNVSGVRFMYGFESVNDPASRVLLMIPCNNTSTHLAIPNSIILPQGYMAHTGVRISFEKTWQLLYNHTQRFSEYFPGLPFNKIMRGSFMGINSLLTLLQTENCAGINFNFGYDDTIAEASAKNKPVFEAVDVDGFFWDPPFDFTAPCPRYCDFGMEHLLQTAGIAANDTEANSLTLDHHFRDEYLLKNGVNGPLVEMYYYANPSIKEKIAAIKNSGQVYENTFEPQITAFNQLLADCAHDEAKAVFEGTLQGMIKTYLFQ